MDEISGQLLTKLLTKICRLARYPEPGMGTAELNEAIERLYSTFGSYPLRDRIDACPCCRGPQETRHLHTKTLRELSAEDLGLYTFRAMTTVGDVDDFRHFLPRILELVAELPTDREVVLSKLTYAEWTEWPAAEIEAVRTYLTNLWSWARRQPPDPYPYFPAEIGSWLCAIARAEADLGPYLQAWIDDKATAAQDNLGRFIADERQALEGADSPGAFWEDATEQWQQVKSWVKRCGLVGESG